MSDSERDDSPFHKGEQAIQTRFGVRDKLERFGRKVIRDFMPDQHREFFHQLPYVFVGYADDQDWPWASVLIGEPGFMVSGTPSSLSIKGNPLPGDKLGPFLKSPAGDQQSMGLLGIELETRRRNRLSAHVTAVENGMIELGIDQSFGNCPKYIQARRMIKGAELSGGDRERIEFTELDADALALIQRSDTFFVSSYVATKKAESASGVDVSHRGGRPGFVRTDDATTLTIPDYKGNFHFNTLGNFLVNPKAGLLFIDFETGDILSLTGTVEILWDDPDALHFEGAERLWQFKVDHGFRLKNALSNEWEFSGNSTTTDLTGTWVEADEMKRSANKIP